MARQPKVYAAEIDGLHEWIVAAPNQAEALAAFGVNQDLFKQGLAHVAEDPKAIAVARATPGTPLRRLKGSGGAFEPADSDGADAWSKAAEAAGAKGRRAPRKAKPDRSALDRAEADLRAFEQAAEEAIRALDDEARSIEVRRRALLREQDVRRKDLQRKRDAEQRRFARQG